MNTLEQKIESLLFFKNEPLSYPWLAKTLEVEISEVEQALERMKTSYKHRGVVLINNKETVSLMTHPDCQDLIKKLTDVEDQKELSQQALETLAIIAYKNGVTKAEIDYIRGVNSVFILRNLLIRGLIAKKTNPQDKRSPYYIPTHDLLSFLGVEDLTDLPEYESFLRDIQKIEQEYHEESHENETL